MSDGVRSDHAGLPFAEKQMKLEVWSIMPILTILFVLTAALYASVGFGGGSTYTALLVLNDVDYRILPSISLICNLIVVTGGTIRFARAGQIDWRAIAPFIVASIPAAWIGGRIEISQSAFVAALGLTLALAGLHLLTKSPAAAPAISTRRLWIALPAGAVLGLVSGLVGIGGGIFLAPLLHVLRWGNPRKIAGACSLFILVNSGSGLAGQAMKRSLPEFFAAAGEFWPLFAAVFVGGAIGSQLGVRVLPEHWLRRLTALLILYAAARLLLRWLAET